MTVLILGASGILGQSMRLCIPDQVRVVFHRRTADNLHAGADLTDHAAMLNLLESVKPSVVINLAGESRPDVVEKNPLRYEIINVQVPVRLAQWCASARAQLIHVSTQAVFSGDNPPYAPSSKCEAANEYGEQKEAAEYLVRAHPGTIVVRPTFVLGVRPLPHIGRPNPVEQMFEGQAKQVSDRWFSTLFARDAAQLLWAIAVYGSPERIVHLGNPISRSRHDIAKALGVKAEQGSHSDFPGIAPRPRDTAYAAGSTRWVSTFDEGIAQLKRDWRGRRDMDVTERAREIALFLGIREDEAYERLSKGFGHQHKCVNDDFRRANPKTDDELLDWYRTTEEYIWELSAYHADPGFNYAGMCSGIAERLKAAGAKRVLCLGDGIGDLTLAMHKEGFAAVYHDLAESRTVEFARFQFRKYVGQEMNCDLTIGWNPDFETGPFDAIVSLDFLEHCVDVPLWMGAIKEALAPSGLLVAQNAFGIGSGPDGSIPMHLSVNDRYVEEWDPMLASMGFVQESSNWYRRAA